MSNLNDEFRFLPGDAARVGRTDATPTVVRTTVNVSENRQISLLAFEPDAQPEYVFLHGMGLNAHGFDPVILALNAPAISLDLPGHGSSDWRADAQYRPDLLAQDIVLALRQLVTEPITLVGHSLGGLTAILVAATAPELVRHLVLIDITPGVTPAATSHTLTEFIQGKSTFDSVEEAVDRAITFGIGSNRDALRRGVSLNTRFRPDGKLEWAHHFAHMSAPADAADSAETGSAQTDSAPNLSTEPSTPATVISPFDPLWQPLEQLATAGMPLFQVGAESGMVTATEIADWITRLPGAQATSLPGPHNLHEASPKELAEIIHTFSNSTYNVTTR